MSHPHKRQKHPAFTQGVFGFDDPRRRNIFLGGAGPSVMRRRKNEGYLHAYNSLFWAE
jgi:hypothetical protein